MATTAIQAGFTALMLSAENGRVAEVSPLIAAGADVNTQSDVSTVINTIYEYMDGCWGNGVIIYNF